MSRVVASHYIQDYHWHANIHKRESSVSYCSEGGTEISWLVLPYSVSVLPKFTYVEARSIWLGATAVTFVLCR